MSYYKNEYNDMMCRVPEEKRRAMNVKRKKQKRTTIRNEDLKNSEIYAVYDRELNTITYNTENKTKEGIILIIP